MIYVMRQVTLIGSGAIDRLMALEREIYGDMSQVQYKTKALVAAAMHGTLPTLVGDGRAPEHPESLCSASQKKMLGSLIASFFLTPETPRT